MKTKMIPVLVTKEMINDFENIFGKQHKLRPTFPMILYRYIEVTWESSSPSILREQHCTCTKELVIGETYQCQVVLEQQRQKHDHTFYTQSLFVYDKQGEECFRCVSKLVTNSPLRKKK